jgi:hypothetical protein
MQADNPYGPTGSVSPGVATSGSVRSVCIQKVDVLSSAKMMGMMYVLFGLIFAAFVLIASIFGVAMGGGNAAGIGGAFLMAVMMPVLYGLGGFIGGAIAAVIYNVVAGMGGGGIRIDLGP